MSRPLRVLRCPLLVLVAILATGSAISAQQVNSGGKPRSGKDSAFAAMQERGKTAMGVDQYTSVHHFTDLPDGGRIVLERDPADTAGVRTIRAHLRDITDAFTKGDFRIPAMVHAEQVPGTAVMAARRRFIRYAMVPRPGGGEVRITTTDPQALAAVHAFLAYQRKDHRAGH